MNDIEDKLSKIKFANFETEKECLNLKNENSLLKIQVCTKVLLLLYVLIYRKLIKRSQLLKGKLFLSNSFKIFLKQTQFRSKTSLVLILKNLEIYVIVMENSAKTKKKKKDNNLYFKKIFTYKTKLIIFF